MKYNIDTVLDHYEILELLNIINSSTLSPAAIGNGYTHTIDTSVRSASTTVIDYYEANPEIYLKLLSLVPASQYNYSLKEWQLVKYVKGDQFKKHIDTLDNHRNPRVYTMVTMLEKTMDLEGGELILYDTKDTTVCVNLDVGQTIVFMSTIPHKVNKVIAGERKVLINWVYKN